MTVLNADKMREYGEFIRREVFHRQIRYMFTRRAAPIFSAALLCAALGLTTQPMHARFFQTNSPPPGNSNAPADQAAGPPSEAELRARAKKLVANQHRNDAALDLFERVEEHIDHAGGANSPVTKDRTYLIIPNGSGNCKILLKDMGKPVSAAMYRNELQSCESTLEMMADPDNPKAKQAYQKYQKRKRDRTQFVNAAQNAFLPKWLGHDSLDGYFCDVFQLYPNPKFHPHSMLQNALTHVRAKVWVDPETNELVYGEARVVSDVSFGAGILGKLYRGGFVKMKQAEVAPGIWEPTRYQYDFSGRKFLFPFEEHELIEVSHYRRVGPPKEALALVRQELASGKARSGDL